MNNKVVARFRDGRVIKGTTVDFSPGKDVFHVIDADSAAGAPPVRIPVRQLKAVFFVKDLAGNPDRDKSAPPSSLRPASGRKVRVVFTDGEVLTGTTAGYQPGRPGFFVEPENPNSNETRCYVLAEATQDITLL